MPDASVVLLTFNGEQYLDETLKMLGRQNPRPAEILAIDSGSTDRTLEILKTHEIRTIQIEKSEFSHPRTRNRAARLIKNRYLIFLTQDATPADSCWLSSLLQPFEEFPHVAGSFSRQIARPRSDLLDANDLHIYFKTKRELKTLPGDRRAFIKDIWHYIQFSNASAAYDRQLLLEYPFDETLEMAEDQEWAKRMLENGYAIAYEPASVVLHSHNHSIRDKYDRNFSMGRSFSLFLSPVLGPRHFPLGAWAVHLLLDARFLLSARDSIGRKIKAIILSPLHRGAMHLAYYKGWKSQLRRSAESIVRERKTGSARI